MATHVCLTGTIVVLVCILLVSYLSQTAGLKLAAAHMHVSPV